MNSPKSLAVKYYQNYIANFSGINVLAWKGLFANFVASIIFGFALFFSIYFINQYHFSVMYSGFLVTCYGMGTMLGAIIAGKLSDSYPAGKIGLYSLFIQMVSYALLIMHIPTYLLPFTMMLLGIGCYGFITANTLWVLARCQKNSDQRLKSLNLLSVSSNLGQGIAAVIISQLNINDFHLLFFCILSILLALSLFLLVTEKQVSQNLSQITIEKKPVSRQFIPNKKINYILLGVLFAGIVFSQLGITYPIFLQSRFETLGIKSFSILLMINTFMIVIFQGPIVTLVNHYNKMFMVNISLLLLSISLLVLNYAHIYVFAIISIILMTIGEIIFFSLSQSLCYENTSVEKKGTIIGIYRMVYAFSRMIGPIIGSALYHYQGPVGLWHTFFLIGLLISFLNLKNCKV